MQDRHHFGVSVEERGMAVMEGETRVALRQAFEAASGDAVTLAAIAISVLDGLGISEGTLDRLANGMLQTCDGYCHDGCG